MGSTTLNRVCQWFAPSTKAASSKDFFHSVSISAWRVLIGTLINMVLIVLTAYPLSRPATHFKARKWYMLYFSKYMENRKDTGQRHQCQEHRIDDLI